MRLNLLRLCFFFCFFLFLSKTSKTQNCIPTNISGVYNLACNQVCSTFTFQIPHIKSSSDYTLVSVPYTPYPYNTPTGTEDIALYDDDFFSNLISLPFSFCFYGQTYTRAVVGSNGIMTFDQSNASCANAYLINQTIPYAGGTMCTIGSTYYPRASIMGAYSDLDPSPGASPATRKIQWEVVGTAPCRKFVVSYYHIGVFSGSCPTPANTFQMVIHESTGIVEVFIQQKACVSSTNGGRSILGIQNWERDRAVAAPGKNNTFWAENNTGYRFIPSAGTSRYVVSELLDMTGTVLITADTATTTTGLLDVSFTNYCPPAGNNQYVVRTTFSACDNPANFLTSLDTITINRTNSLNAVAATTNTACGPPSGTITVTVPAGIGTPPYTFVLDGGAPVTAPSPYTFNNVAAGPHTVVVTDASGGCSSTLNPTVILNNGINANTTFSPTACTGVANGTITVTPTTGTAPYTYSLDGGAPIAGPVPYTFTNVASGAHTILVTDAAGCVTPLINVTVTVGPGITANAIPSATSCPTASNGSITVTATAGTAPFTFQLDGGPIQSGASPYTFINVAAGPHTVFITDNIGCTRTININVAAGPTLTANAIPTATSCSGATNGSITVTPNSGVAPYTFSLDGGAPVGGVPPYTFTNLNPGPHTIIVTDGIGCITNTINVTIAAGPALTTTANKTDVSCNGGANGSITVAQPVIGTAPYEYSLDGTIWQSSNIFNGLTAGNYTVFYRESNGCQGTLSITVAEPATLTASSAFVPVVCNGQNNGIITITSGGGITPYEYSINGGTNWQSSNLFNVAAGSHTIIIRDANNCTTTQTVTVTEPAVLSASSANGPASCDGGNDGVITITAAGGNAGYEYSIDGGANWQTNNVFNVGPGNFTVTVRDNLNCTTSFPTTVLLGSNFTMTPQADPTICEGTSTQLQLTSNATQYAWSPASGLSSATISNPVANPTATTQYIVTATLGRCSANDTVIVNVNPAPVPNAGADGFICFGQTYQLNANGGTQYQWTPDDYLNSTTIPNPISAATRDITYTLSILSDINGCASLTTDQVSIDVTPPLKVKTFPYDTIGYSGDQFQLLAIPNDSDVVNYSWSPATGLSDATIPNPIVTLGANGDIVQYQVITSTVAGCRGEGYITVRVYKGPDIYVATAFTPNDDGRNDRFLPIPVGIKSLNYFRVFSRWGQMVFQTSQLHDGWDGRINGVKQGSGVYVWMIEAITNDNRVITKKGTVTLIR